MFSLLKDFLAQNRLGQKDQTETQQNQEQRSLLSFS
jgi:hypothetical protein